MKKEFYCLVSRDADFRELEDEPSFQSPCQYDPVQYAKLLENEFGRLDLKYTRLKILIDLYQKKNCPWCGCEEKKNLVVSKLDFPEEYCQYMCSVCINCKARGPTLIINRLNAELNPEAVDDFLDRRWNERTSNLK